MRDESASETVANDIFSGTWYLVAIPGLMILVTVVCYVVVKVKKCLIDSNKLSDGCFNETMPEDKVQNKATEANFVKRL